MKATSLRMFIVLAVLALTASMAHAMDLQLKGKTALITGSTGGIGYGIAKVLLNEGAQVIINGRTQATVDKASAALQQATGKAPLGFAGDMSKADDIAHLVKAYPTVDILINNVARFAPHEFTQSTDQDWYETFDLNVMSGVRLSRAYLPGMKQRNWGRIIFISRERAADSRRERGIRHEQSGRNCRGAWDRGGLRQNRGDRQQHPARPYTRCR